jgi:hypothetical protein
MFAWASGHDPMCAANHLDNAVQKERDPKKERGGKVLALIPLDLDGYLFSTDYTDGKAQAIRSVWPPTSKVGNTMTRYSSAESTR